MSNATTKIHPAYHTTSGKPVHCACGAVDASEPCQWDGIGAAALVRKVGTRTEYVLSAECAERYVAAGDVEIIRDATEADAVCLAEGV